jgi:hypothetical protein
MCLACFPPWKRTKARKKIIAIPSESLRGARIQWGKGRDAAEHGDPGCSCKEENEVNRFYLPVSPDENNPEPRRTSHSGEG